MKYLVCLLPMILCIEVVSYACLATVGVMFIFDVIATGKGWSNGTR